MKDPKDPGAGAGKTILAHGHQNQQEELRRKQQQYQQQQQPRQPQHQYGRAPSQPLTPQQAASGGHIQNPQHAPSPWQGQPSAGYPAPASGGGLLGNPKLVLAGAAGLALLIVIIVVVATQSGGGGKDGETKTATGEAKSGGDGDRDVKSNVRKVDKPFDVSLDEAFTNGDFTYKITKLRVSRSISSLARASDGARFLTIKFEQQNNANEMRKIPWFRDFELRSSDGKKFTASKVGSEALLIRKRGINYREAEVQSGVNFEGATAFEIPLPVLDDHKLLFIFKHAQGDGETRVLLQKPDIANWVLVEPYLRPALIDPTPATVKRVMGKTKESDSAIAAYANALLQYMNAYTAERDEWRARKRSLKNLEEISSEQEGDRLTITRFLKKRGKASERPKLKLVTTATKEGTYVLTSVALSFGNK